MTLTNSVLLPNYYMVTHLLYKGVLTSQLCAKFALVLKRPQVSGSFSDDRSLDENGV